MLWSIGIPAFVFYRVAKDENTVHGMTAMAYMTAGRSATAQEVDILIKGITVSQRRCGAFTTLLVWRAASASLCQLHFYFRGNSRLTQRGFPKTSLDVLDAVGPFSRKTLIANFAVGLGHEHAA